MERLRNVLTWYGLLTRRFIRKKMYTFLLFCIPLLVFAMQLAAKEESGILHILLVCSEEAEEETISLVDELIGKKGMIYYERETDQDSAWERVSADQADGAWIFPDNFSASVDAFVQGKAPAVIHIYEREDTIPLQLAREQLFGTLYPRLSEALSKNYLEEKGIFEDMTQEEAGQAFSEAYEGLLVEESIFRFVYLDQESADIRQDSFSYLTAPLRGMLAVMVLLCGMAVTLFYMQDEEKGLFQWMPIRYPAVFPLLYVLTGIFPSALAAYIALLLSGTFTSWGREGGLLLLYLLGVGGFCQILRCILGRIRRFAAAIPIILILCVALCPVFIGFRPCPALQQLLPPYTYLLGLHDPDMALRLALYGALTCLAGCTLEKVSERNVAKN